MTDLEKMKNTFNELSVMYEIKTSQEVFGETPTNTSYDGTVTWDISLNLNNGVGYYSSECIFYFLDGKYQTHGCWE